MRENSEVHLHEAPPGWFKRTLLTQNRYVLSKNLRYVEDFNKGSYTLSKKKINADSCIPQISEIRKNICGQYFYYDKKDHPKNFFVNSV